MSLKNSAQCTVLFLTFFALAPHQASAMPPKGAKGVISCSVSLAFQSQNLAAKRQSECIGQKTRKCPPNLGDYILKGPLVESKFYGHYESRWEYYGERLFFKPDGKSAPEGEAPFSLSVNYTIFDRDVLGAREPLDVDVNLFDTRKNAPQFSFALPGQDMPRPSNFGSTVPMRAGDTLSLAIYRPVADGLQYEKPNGDDVLTGVFAKCGRLKDS